MKKYLLLALFNIYFITLCPPEQDQSSYNNPSGSNISLSTGSIQSINSIEEKRSPTHFLVNVRNPIDITIIKNKGIINPLYQYHDETSESGAESPYVEITPEPQEIKHYNEDYKNGQPTTKIKLEVLNKKLSESQRETAKLAEQAKKLKTQLKKEHSQDALTSNHTSHSLVNLLKSESPQPQRASLSVSTPQSVDGASNNVGSSSITSKVKRIFHRNNSYGIFKNID